MARKSSQRAHARSSKPSADWFDILFCEQGAKKEYVSETDISHTAPLCFSFVKIATLTELDLQSATPSPAVTEMRPFERIAKIVSERLVCDVQNVEARSADDSFTLEDRDTRREIEDRAWLDTPALEIHKLSARRCF